MDRLRIRGGQPLQGSVRVAGAKNAALKMLAAGLLTTDELALSNVPMLAAITTMGRLLAGMGVEVARDRDTVTGRSDGLTSTEPAYDLVKTMLVATLATRPLTVRARRTR